MFTRSMRGRVLIFRRWGRWGRWCWSLRCSTGFALSRQGLFIGHKRWKAHAGALQIVAPQFPPYGCCEPAHPFEGEAEQEAQASEKMFSQAEQAPGGGQKHTREQNHEEPLVGRCDGIEKIAQWSARLYISKLNKTVPEFWKKRSGKAGYHNDAAREQESSGERIIRDQRPGERRQQAQQHAKASKAEGNSEQCNQDPADNVERQVPPRAGTHHRARQPVGHDVGRVAGGPEYSEDSRHGIPARRFVVSVI